jgi:hypothetical protein
MALDWILWTVGIWLLIGAVCAGLVYQDQVYRGAKGMKWPLLCIPLSLIGYYLYHTSLRQHKPMGRELPAQAHYGAPEYKFEETNHEWKEAEKAPVAAPTQEKDTVPTLAPVAEVGLGPDQAEPLAPPPVEKDVRPAEERVDPNKAKVQKIEGIPRCSECGAAVSSYDEACLSCGASLRQ